MNWHLFQIRRTFWLSGILPLTIIIISFGLLLVPVFGVSITIDSESPSSGHQKVAVQSAITLFIYDRALWRFVEFSGKAPKDQIELESAVSALFFQAPFSFKSLKEEGQT